MEAVAQEILRRADRLATHSEEAGRLKRTFLSAPMRGVQDDVRAWMEAAGLAVSLDAAGNIRGQRGGAGLLIGSHLDTVPDAGRYDGVLGVLMGIALAGLTKSAVEVVGFSEEEGVRFGVPFLGSRALVGELDDAMLAKRDVRGVSVREAITEFGLDVARLHEAQTQARGYLEIHIEQGPVLESLGLSLGVVETIAGQTRATVHFGGHANHAGTTPMHLRRDALAGAAEWIAMVEREACVTDGLVATVGRIEVTPGAGNVVAGSADVSLDVRHAEDRVRHAAVERLLRCAKQVAARRGLEVSSEIHLDQAAVKMDAEMIDRMCRAVEDCGFPVHRMNSGAGHDAMILARHVPSAMLFLRSPGGISHHPEEAVLAEDVAAALRVGERFLELFANESELNHG